MRHVILRKSRWAIVCCGLGLIVGAGEGRCHAAQPATEQVVGTLRVPSAARVGSDGTQSVPTTIMDVAVQRQPAAENLPPAASRTAAAAMPEERPIGSLTAAIAPPQGTLPSDLSPAHRQRAAETESLPPCLDVIYFWDAPDFCHRSLYFEEANLERYGYSRFPAIQPAISAGRFVASTVSLPYLMTVHPPRECRYPLGHYRPGSPVPYQPIWPAWDPKAAAVQGAVVVGGVFLIP